MREVKNISEKIHKTFFEESSEFHYQMFPYFKRVCCYGSFQYYFLIVRKE